MTDSKDTLRYTYDSTWKDLLVSYDGQSISYDAIGNPTKYLEFDTLSWTGRNLDYIKDGNTFLSFYTYDIDGLRRTKRVGNTETEYIYTGGQLSALKVGNDMLYFTYDANGTLVSVKYNNDIYYYVINPQGDVVGLCNENGNPIATYTYDEWGYPLSAPTSGIGALNPFRYRGYIYDEETGFYLTGTRYYDPEVGRFINADSILPEPGVSNSLLGYNLYIYCYNNPVNNYDPTGNLAISTCILIGSIIVGVCAAGYTAAVSYQNTGKVDWESTIVSGMSMFMFCYTAGMSVYGMYLYYCDFSGHTPVTSTGSPPSSNYPPNDGFNSTPRNSTLLPGSVIQRSGGESGVYVAPINTNTVTLSLPPDKVSAPITYYTVTKPIDVQAGTALPWYGQPGGGTQFVLPNPISELISNGYLTIFSK